MSDRGELAEEKRHIAGNGGTHGFETLWENGRLDLSVEALVLQLEYRALFTDAEIELCENRLREYGYPS